MACRERATNSEDEIAAAIERVLDEDRRKDYRVTKSKEACDVVTLSRTKSGDFNDNASGASDAKSMKDNDRKAPEKLINYCCCKAKGSSRFSVLVMEALRSLQRESCTFIISSIDDIVEHIQQNYATDGDVYAQSLTALKQVCSQGFVLEVLKNEYHLVGPLANSMNESLADRTDCLSVDRSLESSNRQRSCSKSCKQSSCSLKRKRLDSREPRRGTTNKSNDGFEEDLSVDEESQETENNCGCEATKRRNDGNGDNLREKRLRRASGDFQRNSSMRTRASSQRSRNQIVDRDSGTEESNDADDQDFRESQSSTPKLQDKKRSEELKEWIKNCQEECKRRRQNQR